MKVICINNSPAPNRHNRLLHLLKEGNTYTVLHKVMACGTDSICGRAYLLEETYIEQVFKNTAFGADRFIPCSDIDEMELVNEMAEVNHI